MSDNQLSPGSGAPHEVDVIIEIGPDQGPVKYEICKESGRLRVDRFLKTAMSYPCHYGYVPSTLCGDGDPCDVLVMAPHDLIPGAIITVRPISMLVMEDEAGIDNKILAVPVESLSAEYDQVNALSDVPQVILDRIEHFFKHYKDLDQNKWVKVKEWKDKAAAISEIEESIKSYTKS